MTAKSHKFPLPLSSLDNKSTHRTTKSHHSATVATPQTATQNVRQHVARQQAVKNNAGLSEDKSAKNTVVVASARKSTSAQAVQTTQAGSSQPSKPMSSGNLAAPRRAMVQRLSQAGVQDSVVLDAMDTVPRHVVIESGLVGQAYVDASLPIGHHQTISQPYIVARMIEIMRNGRKLRNVLEIGTGCGYQAAVLAQLCENVYSIERIKLLHELAKKNLRSLRIANLRLHYGDGMHGLPQVAPFDGVILAAAGMQIPDALLQQLAIGGRLIAPVGERQQVLQLIERTGNANWTKTVLEQCHFVPLRPGII